MSLAYYFDVHVPRSICDALQNRGIDVLTAQDDNASEWTDSDLIDRATELGRILVSQDADMLREANQRQRSGIVFSGVVYGHQRKNTIGQAVSDLQTIAELMSHDDMRNHVERIPL